MRSRTGPWWFFIYLRLDAHFIAFKAETTLFNLRLSLAEGVWAFRDLNLTVLHSSAFSKNWTQGCEVTCILTFSLSHLSSTGLPSHSHHFFEGISIRCTEQSWLELTRQAMKKYSYFFKALRYGIEIDEAKTLVSYFRATSQKGFN
jgi:hypothetical protein